MTALPADHPPHNRAMPHTKLPSIRLRLARALLAWAIVCGVAVAVAVWLTVREEVDELLDDTLQASSLLLTTALDLDDGRHTQSALAAFQAASQNTPPAGDQFAWQVVGPGGQLLLRSPLAPAVPFHAVPRAGFTDPPGWRVFGSPLRSASAHRAADADKQAPAGRMLYVAQVSAERDEVQAEIAMTTALIAFTVGLLGYLWLRIRVQHELAPLQTLSDRLSHHDPLDASASLGPAERVELQPIHTAIDALALRLNQRLLHERAFTAHAAHSLRTPLAGIDAQLAVALRECPPELQGRLQRVRDGASRLQRVVTALLTMFRAGVELQRQSIDLPALVNRLPVDGLSVEVPPPTHPLQADPDLLAAALLNLLDNSLRNGAKHVLVSIPEPNTVRVQDDGPGTDAARRLELQTALGGQSYEGHTGLGLMLADLVARSHGGQLLLPDGAEGFTAELKLG